MDLVSEADAGLNTTCVLVATDPTAALIVFLSAIVEVKDVEKTPIGLVRPDLEP